MAGGFFTRRAAKRIFCQQKENKVSPINSNFTFSYLNPQAVQNMFDLPSLKYPPGLLTEDYTLFNITVVVEVNKNRGGVGEEEGSLKNVHEGEVSV